MTAPKTSPAMGPEQQVDGGEQHEADLGLVTSPTDRQQVLGTCSPELIARLEHIRDTCITSPEKRAVQDCIDTVPTREQIAEALSVCTCPKGRNQHGYWRQVSPECPACGTSEAKADAVLALLKGDQS